MVFRMGHKMRFDASRGVSVFRFENVPVDAHRDLDIRVPGTPPHHRGVDAGARTCVDRPVAAANEP
jgi:hypothetical protein